MSERDKFLTEAMGYKWHKCQDNPNGFFCNDCADNEPKSNAPLEDESTEWDWFGQTWEWAQQQEWWYDFKMGYCGEHWSEFSSEPMAQDFSDDLIHPDRFADAVYEFLKDRHE